MIRFNYNDYLEKGVSPLHKEYVIVTRGGKTFIQRYNKKSPENVEEPKSLLTTQKKSELINKIYFSHLYNGEFYDSEGKRLMLNDEWKNYAKKLKKNDYSKTLTDSMIDASLELENENQLSDEEKEKIKKDVFKRDREKFLSNVLPKIKERESRLEAIKNKKLKSWENSYKKFYTEDRFANVVRQHLNNIDQYSDLHKISSELKNVQSLLKNPDAKLIYTIAGTNHESNLNDFLKKVESRINNKQGGQRPGISRVFIEGLDNIKTSQTTMYKTLDEYIEGQMRLEEAKL